MVEFTAPSDLMFNRGPIADPRAFAAEVGCASWLCLTGTEFAEMEGGMSYDAVREAVDVSMNVVSDPPRVLDLELARRHVDALDQLPRPTLVSCRTGPRASAVVYLYAGLKEGVSAEEVVAAAKRDGAPCSGFPDYLAWIATSMDALRAERPQAD
jgi:protein tyrosine phosphatase (PTP) superfamily phosphohydrolase (DUF442 family)